MGRPSPQPPCPPSWAPTHRRVLRAQRLLPDLQGIVEQVCGLFVLVLVSVEQPRGQGVRPGPWAGLTLAGQELAELGVGAIPRGSLLGVPTPPRSGTGSLPNLCRPRPPPHSVGGLLPTLTPLPKSPWSPQISIPFRPTPVGTLCCRAGLPTSAQQHPPSALQRQRPPPVHERQDVEHGGHVGVAVTRAPLQVLQGLPAQRHGHLVAALARVLDHQVVQGPEAGWDLVATLLGRRGPCCLGTWGCVRGTESLQASCSPSPHRRGHKRPQSHHCLAGPWDHGPLHGSGDGKPRPLSGPQEGPGLWDGCAAAAAFLVLWSP